MLKKRITESDVLRQVGDENIFSKYFQPFKIGKSYCSKIRNDKNPSCGIFQSGNGRLIYNDFSTSESFNSIAYVAHIFSLDYRGALNKIAEDFNIINKSGKSYESKSVINKIKEIPKKIIQIEVEKWNESNLNYWATYGINENELKSNRVYAVKECYIDGWRVPNNENLSRYGLYLKDFDGKEYIKLYTPLHPDKKRKWISSCPLSLIIGLNELEYKSDTLIICKSMKERLICLKFHSDVISIQSENKGSIKKEVVEELFRKYKRIIYISDNDEPGLKFMEYIKSLGIECYYFIDKLRDDYKIKDIGDFSKIFGIEYLKKYFKKYINLVVS